MTDKQIIFKCDVDCIRKNTEECFELDCIKGQESILKQLKRKEQECENLKKQIKIIDDEIIVVEITEKQFEEYQKLKQSLTEIKQLLSDALDTDKTDAEQSFDNIHKAIKLCEVLDEEV